MAQPTLATLISRTRRYIRDYGMAQDALTASVTSTATTVTVADATSAVYTANWIIEVEQEAMLVVSGTGTTLTIRRASWDSTNASHASGTLVLIRPRFLAAEIIDALNQGIQAAFPLIYKPVIDTSLTTTADTYEYTIPTMPSDTDIVVPYISTVTIKESGDFAYRERNDWDVVRGATPKLRFRRQQPVGATIRIEGFGPFPKLTTTASTLDALWPRQADYLLVEYAASELLASGETARVRFDVGVRDDREEGTRTGSSLNASNALHNRFLATLNRAAMPPMPRHVQKVI